MKPAFTDVVANERLRTRLGTDLQSGTLSHAYILEGMPGSGKHTIALRIAAALACDHRTDSTTPLPRRDLYQSRRQVDSWRRGHS